MSTPIYLTLEEAAELARAPLATVRYWITLGKLKSVKPGRHRLVRRDVLIAFIEGTGDPDRPAGPKGGR